LDGLETRQINAAEIDAARRQRLLAHGNDDVRTRAEKLFQAASNSDRAQVVAGYQSALTLAGDATRGNAHFKRVCANCHRLGDVGFAVGPELSSLTDKSKPALLVAVLDPNRAVESKYLSYTATTTAGLTHTGILSAETGNSISLLAAEGKQVQLLRGELDEFASSTKSLMPDGLEKDLTPQELADLLAFLGSTRAPRRVFPGNEPELVRPEALRGELSLLARQCEVRGSTLVFEPRYGNLGYWMSEDDHATWSIEITKAGEYQVWIDYACDDSTAGNSLTVAVGNAQVTGKIVGTGTWDTYIERAIGQMHLPAGRHELVVRPAGPPQGAVIDLKSVRLYPLKKR
jgi:putative heme-binding domain-containing protein